METVKPNRLKINLDFGTDKFTKQEATGELDVKWLHGAPGRNLKAEFDMLMVRVPTEFPRYKEYILKTLRAASIAKRNPVFSGVTNDEG